VFFSFIVSGRLLRDEIVCPFFKFQKQKKYVANIEFKLKIRSLFIF